MYNTPKLFLVVYIRIQGILIKRRYSGLPTPVLYQNESSSLRITYLFDYKMKETIKLFYCGLAENNKIVCNCTFEGEIQDLAISLSTMHDL